MGGRFANFGRSSGLWLGRVQRWGNRQTTMVCPTQDFVAAAGAVGLFAARIPAANDLDRIFGRQCLAGWRVHSVPRFDAWPADIRWGGNHRYPITDRKS